jgi:hypothetical protein
MRLTLLGVGAMSPPRYQPAGLLLSARGRRVMIDGGPGAEPEQPIDAWLVTDDRAELIREIRRLARARGTEPAVASYTHRTVRADPHPWCTPRTDLRIPSFHPGSAGWWAPEFWRFPTWAAAADLMFADAAGWNRPIHFARNVGGHASVHDTARAARDHGVRPLVFAHIGRPSIRAIDAGLEPPFGEWGTERRIYQLR